MSAKWVTINLTLVIPGREPLASEPGIHTHYGGYGFLARASHALE
jgi:hypothetical protein